ncbi:MAG TPA: hypothetical protein VGN72_01270 [Tepidisphaeraceae bacterium]|jgi:hypothetical protein|nr:hypothetical protein [Tepidisphaeraceae bacterium]
MNDDDLKRDADVLARMTPTSGKDDGGDWQRCGCRKCGCIGTNRIHGFLRIIPGDGVTDIKPEKWSAEDQANIDGLVYIRNRAPVLVKELAELWAWQRAVRKAINESFDLTGVAAVAADLVLSCAADPRWVAMEDGKWRKVGTTETASHPAAGASREVGDE